LYNIAENFVLLCVLQNQPRLCQSHILKAMFLSIQPQPESTIARMIIISTFLWRKTKMGNGVTDGLQLLHLIHTRFLCQSGNCIINYVVMMVCQGVLL